MINDLAFPGLLWGIGSLLWLFAGDIANGMLYATIGAMLVALSNTTQRNE